MIATPTPSWATPGGGYLLCICHISISSSKFAYLFNGEYDMCRHGFDEDMINAPTAEGLTAAGTHIIQQSPDM